MKKIIVIGMLITNVLFLLSACGRYTVEYEDVTTAEEAFELAYEHLSTARSYENKDDVRYSAHHDAYDHYWTLYKELTEEEEPKTEEPSLTEEEIKEQEKEKRKSAIKSSVQNIVYDNTEDTTIKEATINDNYGTDIEDDYIVSLKLRWDRKNSVNTTKDMLNYYYNEIAYNVGKELNDVVELVVYWEVPYIDSSGNNVSKANFKRNKQGMYFDSEDYWF